MVPVVMYGVGIYMFVFVYMCYMPAMSVVALHGVQLTLCDVGYIT